MHVSRHVSKYGLAWPGMAWHVRMYVCMHAWMFSSSRGPRVSVRSDHLVHAVISMLVLVNLPRQPAYSHRHGSGSHVFGGFLSEVRTA